MNRRDFMKTALAGLGLTAGFGATGSSEDKPGRMARPKALLKLGSQEGRLPGNSLKEKVQNLLKYGGTGLEVGSGNLPGRIKEIKEALAGTGVRISAVCAADGPFIIPDERERRRKIDNAKMLLSSAAELSGTGVIMVPAFNSARDQLSGEQGRDLLLRVLAEIGEHATKVGSRILIEPLNRGEAFFLRQLADAAAICRDANLPGVAMMGDLYHMAIEETSDLGAFISAGKYLHHVHLASRTRVLPGQDDRDFADAFRGLKMIGYQDYLSLECGCKGDPAIEIPKSFRFLEEEWEKAVA
jgi:sugar phosphate isomerase/epimerase